MFEQQSKGTEFKRFWVSNLEALIIGGFSQSEAEVRYPYRGLMDDLRIYNRILSEEQIRRDMNNPVS